MIIQFFILDKLKEGSLVRDKDGSIFQQGKDRLVNEQCWDNWLFLWKKNKIRFLFFKM